MKSYKEFSQLDEGRQAKLRALRKAERAERASTPGTDAYKAAQAKNAADKGTAIVRQKQGGTSKEAIGAPKQKGQQGIIEPSAIVKRKISSVPDEKQAGKQPGTTRNNKVGYLGKVKDAAGKQFQKNTEKTFGAKSVGKKLGDMPGNAAKAAGKVAGRTFTNLMKQRKPNAGSGNNPVERSMHSSNSIS